MSKQSLEIKKTTIASVAYRDTKYKSRTIVLRDGRTFAVKQSGIEATDPALIAHLDADSDFSREIDAQL